MAREHTGGWETGSAAAEGWETGTTTVTNNHANSHLDAAGNGGNYYADSWNAAAGYRLVQNTHMRTLVECHDRVMVYLAIGTHTKWFIVSGSTRLFTIRMIGSGVMELYRGSTATLVATSAGVLPPQRYLLVQIQYRISDTVGLCEVYVDGALFVTFSGDTKPGAETNFNTFAYESINSHRLDEYGRNSITLEFDTQLVNFTAGQVLTGATSGATVVMTAIEDAGAAGVIVCQQWNGIAFLNNEVITDPLGGSALVNAPNADYVNGFQPNSSRLPEGFVVALVPTGVGTTTQLTSSTGGANWTNVDEIPPNTTDYNSSGTNDQYDTYAHAGSQLPASAVSVVALATASSNMRDGVVINNAQHVIRIGATDYFTANYALPVSYATNWQSSAWNVNPNTGANWSVANANGTEFGFRVKT